jgi:hypothetical protein
MNNKNLNTENQIYYNLFDNESIISKNIPNNLFL